MKNKKNSIIAYFKCSFCGRDLEETEISLHEESGRGVIFHADCAGCKSSSLIVVTGGQTGITSLGIATDLEKDELAGKISGEAVSADEVIDIYQCVSGNGDNFMRLVKDIKD